MRRPDGLSERVPLASRTSLGVGGAAEWFAETSDPIRAAVLLRWAADRSLPVLVLGGGSNLLIADEGVPGLVMRYDADEISLRSTETGAEVSAGAGLDWDRLVERCVREGLAGIECLSGIPGRVGAAPMQNIGAYGQEVASTMRSLRVIDRGDGTSREIAAEDCGFAYRHSRFKADWADRYLVTAVTLELRRGPPTPATYPELAGLLRDRHGAASPTLQDVRDAVLAIRRRKSMVIDPADPDSRSAGSFFTNPIVPEDAADRVARSLPAETAAAMPRYPAAPGFAKLSAAWLIERAGFGRGYAMGAAGLSSKHCLALINRGGAGALDIARLAARIRAAVQDRFDITLTPEPVFVGFSRPTADLLDELAAEAPP